MKTGRKSKRARRLITTARMVFRFQRAASAVPVGRRAEQADRADSNAGGGGGDGVRVVRAAVLAADAGRSNCGEHSSTNCSQKHRSGNGLGGFAIRPVFTGNREHKKEKAENRNQELRICNQALGNWRVLLRDRTLRRASRKTARFRRAFTVLATTHPQRRYQHPQIR
jgi:hypothetical protein